MKNPLHIHPSTVVFFAIVFFTPYKSRFFILYFFILLHELTHMLTALILGEKINKIHLLPFGCMLSLSSVPSNLKSLVIALSGPFFNVLMFAAGIFPKENLALALFNLIPVLPLDGGVILGVLFPRFSFYLSVLSVIILSLFCIAIHKNPLFPVMLFLVLFISEKNKIQKKINSRIITHFFVEKKAEKLYNTIDKL